MFDLCEFFGARRCGRSAGKMRGAAGKVRWVFASCGALLAKCAGLRAECAALRADVQDFFLSFEPNKRPSGVGLMPFMATRCYSSVGWSVRLITVRSAARVLGEGLEMGVLRPSRPSRVLRVLRPPQDPQDPRPGLEPRTLRLLAMSSDRLSYGSAARRRAALEALL